MKAAVVGCGSMGSVHAEAYRRMADVELVAVCDLDAALAEKAAAGSGAAIYSSYEQMMEEADPDVVSITLPTNLHKPFVLQTAQRGKHIICEKPIAPSLADAQEMLEACERHGVKLFIGHVVRFFPEFNDIRRQIESGAIGRIGVVHAKRIGGHPGEQRDWYANDSISGGVMLDLMVHDIDFMRSLLGDVKSVYAFRRVHEQTDYALMTLTFRDSPAIVNLEGYWGYNGPFTTSGEFAGDQGIIRYDSSAANTLQVRRRPVKASEGAAEQPQSILAPLSSLSPQWQNPYESELAHFIDCIRNDKPAIVTAVDGYKAVEVALAALQSAQSGLPVEL